MNIYDPRRKPNHHPDQTTQSQVQPPEIPASLHAWVAHEETQESQMSINIRNSHPPSEHWIRPDRNRYLVRCCSCGYTHVFSFRLRKTGSKNIIEFKASHPFNRITGIMTK